MSEPAASVALPPGSTIGILGAGQLGRMLAVAAARLGLKTHVFAEVRGPATDVSVAQTIGGYDDERALSDFARGVDAVTYEFENVPVATARFLAARVPVRPGARALEIAQDRLIEKSFICGLGIPVASFAAIDDAAQLTATLADWNAPAILKTRRLGYDGKGQVSLAPGAAAEAALAAIGRQPAVLERRIAFEREVSVLLVRSAAGDARAYDIPVNTHADGILRQSSVPAGLDDATTAVALGHAARIADALDYVGLLTVEMFDLGRQQPPACRFIVNEIAPRVHNSGHWTIEACAISQFENHVRAVAGWPLGSCARHADAEMRNLIGDEALDWLGIAAESGAALHLYGKGEVRAGRKMGHVTRLTPITPLSAPGQSDR